MVYLNQEKLEVESEMISVEGTLEMWLSFIPALSH